MASRSPQRTADRKAPGPSAGTGGFRSGRAASAGTRGASRGINRKIIEPKEPQVLRFPQFEWYLGPMYQRFREIQVEKALANRVVEVRKKAPGEVTSILPHEKHTKPRTPCYKFSELFRDVRGEGIRDCGWFKNSWEQDSMHLSSHRKNKASAPRRASATPAAWSYDLQRWPVESWK
mmetsp:Transcript_65698/g.182880  ORF Transcript_65698/g.182880 Transcript_65698/m.182880 type:complete len:177 (-) Transcript_65698:171-701(-)